MYPLKKIFFLIYLAAPGLSCGMQVLFFFFAVATCAMQLSEQGLSPCPLHWELGVLETGPPESPYPYFLN